MKNIQPDNFWISHVMIESINAECFKIADIEENISHF